MSTTNYSNFWEQFEGNTHLYFQEQWNDHDLAIMALATMNDNQIRGHRVILSSEKKDFTGDLQPENIEFVCNNCDAVYKSGLEYIEHI